MKGGFLSRHFPEVSPAKGWHDGQHVPESEDETLQLVQGGGNHLVIFPARPETVFLAKENRNEANAL